MATIRVTFDVVRTVKPGRIQGDGVFGLGGDASLALQESHVGERCAGREDAGLTGWRNRDLFGGDSAANCAIYRVESDLLVPGDGGGCEDGTRETWATYLDSKGRCEFGEACHDDWFV